MQKLLGSAVCVIGVGLLGWYGSANNAKNIQAEIALAASTASAASIHGLKADVSGRDIRLSGIANDKAERDTMLASLEAIPGRRLVRDDTTVLPRQSPFQMTVEKTAVGLLSGGHVPSEKLRLVLSGPLGVDGAGGLILSSGAPDGWADAAQSSVETLTPLITGKLEMSDKAIALSGLALSPKEAALAKAPLADLADGFKVSVILDLLDDGKPFALDVTSAEGMAIWNGGKLPSIMSAEALDAAYGSTVEGVPQIAKVGEDELNWPLAASQSLKGLAALKSGQLRIEDRAVALTGLAANPTDAAAIEAVMNDLPEGFRAEVALEVEDDGTPFRLTLRSSEDGFSGDGKLPVALTTSTLKDLVGAPLEGEIADARIGMKETDFATAVTSGVAALKALKTGKLELTEDTAILTGLAANPDAAAAAEEALSDLPQAFEAVVSLDLEDDGAPMELTVARDPSGLTANGKVPASLDGFIYGDDVNTSDVVLARIGAGDTAFLAAVPAGLQALREIEAGVLHVTDEGVALSGAALNSDAEGRVHKALSSLPDGTEIKITLDVLDDGVPMTLVLSKSEATMTAVGKVPAAMEGFDYGEGTETSGIALAQIGADDTEMASLALAGVQALALMTRGTATLKNGTLTLTGEADSPAEGEAIASLLAGLGEGRATISLSLLDDGAPAAFEIGFGAETGLDVSGKLPKGLKVYDLAQATGLNTVSGEPTQSRLSEEGREETLSALQAAVPWLAVTESLKLKKGPAGGGLSLDIALAPGVDTELVQAAMTEALGDGVALTVSLASPVADGAKRINVSTGEAQVFQGGAWLPVISFDAGADTCQVQSEQALEQSTLNFLSGSARLDGRAVRTINRLTAIARNCLVLENLTLEVGGHTDNQGDEAANIALSLQRAEAVVAAISARGISADRITAQGYGPSQPVASNDSAEGRAANRRTTITWTTVAETPGAASEEVQNENNEDAESGSPSEAMSTAKQPRNRQHV